MEIPSNIIDKEQIRQFVFAEMTKKAQAEASAAAEKIAEKLSAERQKDAFILGLPGLVAKETNDSSIDDIDALIKRLAVHASGRIQKKLGISTPKSSGGSRTRFRPTKEAVEQGKKIYAESENYSSVRDALNISFATAKKLVAGGFDKKVGL